MLCGVLIVRPKHVKFYHLTNLNMIYSVMFELSSLLSSSFIAMIDEGVNVFALNSGWVWTSFQDPLRPAVGVWLFPIVYLLLRFLKFIFAKTPFIGARTIVY